MKSAYRPIWALLLILTASAISQPILAGSVPANDGSVILRMCKGGK